jgi:hypothetical protein
MNSQISHKIKNNKNKDKDKVYTPKEVAEDCINKIKYKIKDTDHLFEPFYGQGVFFNLFGENPKSYTEIDLGLDFFEIDDDIETDYIITNPPYSIMTDIINKIIKMKHLKGFGILVNNLTITPPRLKKLEDYNFFPSDLYIFKVRSWFGVQYFWFFEKLDIKPQTNITYKREQYKY